MSRACPHGGSRTWCETCLNEDLARALQDKAEMLALLRDLEWEGDTIDGTPSCPRCGGYDKTHNDGCTLGAILERLGK